MPHLNTENETRKKIAKRYLSEINNNKITINSDIQSNSSVKYGLGFDLHRLVPNKKLYLGGIKIPSTIGTLGHSDGDPVLHAITDAILGACSMGDIGEKFSDKSKKFKNIRSTILLNEIIKQTQNKGYLINNLDINIITQKPKIQKYKKNIDSRTHNSKFKNIKHITRINSVKKVRIG